MFRLFAALSLLASPVLANSPQVMDCEWQSSAANIAEPWEENTRTFSNGKTRLALLDTTEPAAGWAYMLVLSPPYDELGLRQCKLIGFNGMGFAGMEFTQLNSSYDPSRGLMFTVPVATYDFDTHQPVWSTLWFQLNQATGVIDAQMR